MDAEQDAAASKMAAERIKVQGNEALKGKRFPEAEKFYSQAIGLDPTNGVYYSNRSAACASQGKYEKAEPLYRRTLDGREAALGAVHPHTLISVNNLAIVLSNQGKHEEAEPLYRRALGREAEQLGAAQPPKLGGQDRRERQQALA